MHENPIPDPLDRHDRIEREILYLLTGIEGEQPIWSVDDLGRAIESADEADVAVRDLACAGLAYRTIDGHVFASRAGVRVVQLVGHVT
jgi:hypothetical protein